MTWTKLVRSAAAAAVASGLALGAAAIPASAAPRAAKAVKAVKAAKLIKFTAAGYVTSVGTDTLSLTLDVNGGNQRMKGQSMTVNVPSTARVTREGVVATLADLLPGDHVAIQGIRVDTTFTAIKVHVDAPVVVEPVLEPAPEPVLDPVV